MLDKEIYMKTSLYCAISFGLLSVSITALSEGIDLVPRVTLDGDEGYFDAADAGDNALYLKPSVPAIVGRWRSSEGNRYQLTSDSEKLMVGLKEAEFKYDFGINKMVYQPGLSLMELVKLNSTLLITTFLWSDAY